MPLRNALRSIFLDRANLRATTAGIGSGWYCSKTPSFRALQGALCEALSRFAHVWSESLQKGAKWPYVCEMSIMTMCTQHGNSVVRTNVDRHNHGDALAPSRRLTTEPTGHWTFARVDDFWRLTLRETTVNFKFSREWQTPATLKLPILSLRKLVWVCHYKCIRLERWWVNSLAFLCTM